MVPVPSEGSLGDNPAGNVRVLFNDGHAEMWTKEGKCLMPQISPIYHLVGWVRFSVRNARGWPLDGTVRICWPDGHHKDFGGNILPFIEQWHFALDDSAIIVKSRGPHGPAGYYEYDLHTGKVMDQAYGLSGSALPPWPGLIVISADSFSTIPP